ncbi:SDR family oxidoreductase [Thaumasiovibrio subtropicus]|uniref:SDR family oxidoreductase n=1 Tax=Thaumasiovibrio subtropicus TaxID=1891207 RepID=UPI000B34E871|nr:SDR family oxidoreductase [Thaumasiovibrio subtropicus]
MTNKTILITGATAGIGLAAATHFIDQGWRVVITGRNRSKLNEVATRLGDNVIAMLCDSEDLSAIEALAISLQSQDVFLDALVLNAGVFHPTTVPGTTVEDFDKTMSINVRGPFFTLQSLLPQLRNPCSVVLLSSLIVNKAFAGASLYAASKGALEGLMGGLNLDLAAKGIRINALRPGVTHTEIQGKAGMSDDDIAGLKHVMSDTPLGRIMVAEDLVSALDYLVSPASIAMRGATMDIDGGMGL